MSGAIRSIGFVGIGKWAGRCPFLRAMVGGLARKGVPLNNIRYKFFGPADELLAA
jgi:hypothetical protein